VSAPGTLDDAVARLREGDGDAFRVVYRDVQPALLRYLTVLVGPHEAEDVASETWAQACRDLDRFTGDADGFRGWVTTIGAGCVTIRTSPAWTPSTLTTSRASCWRRSARPARSR
jgi:hypothetical protein